MRKEKVSRLVHTLVQKVSKTIKIYIFKNVEQHCLLITQTSQIEYLQNKRKKKIVIDTNSQFANIADIVRVQKEIAQKKAIYEAQDRAKIAREMANEVMRRDISTFLHQFHAVDDVGVPTTTSTL